MLEGDELEMWFAAFERGEFLQGWETQRQRLQRWLLMWGEGRDDVYDASQD